MDVYNRAFPGTGRGNNPGPQHVRLGVTFGDQFQFVGNCRVPPAARVEKDYAFDSNDSILGLLEVAGIVNPVLFGQTFYVVRGDDQTLIWKAQSGWPDISSGTVKVGFKGLTGEFEKDATVVGGDVQLTLTAAESAALERWYTYDVQHTAVGGNVSTLAIGTLQLLETVTDIPPNQPSPVGWVG